jgi:pentatricopeptide repeat protein
MMRAITLLFLTTTGGFSPREKTTSRGFQLRVSTVNMPLVQSSARDLVRTATIEAQKGDRCLRAVDLFRDAMAQQALATQAVESSEKDHVTCFVGVMWDARRKKWRASVREAGKKKWLGSFPTDLAAARAYDRYAAARNKPVNFPRGGQRQAVKAKLHEDPSKSSEQPSRRPQIIMVGSKQPLASLSMCNQLIVALADSRAKQVIGPSESSPRPVFDNAGSTPAASSAAAAAAAKAVDGLECAVLVYELMKPVLTPDAVTFGSLISRAGSVGKLSLAKRLWRDMEQSGVSPDVMTVNALLNAFAKASKGGEEGAIRAAKDAVRLLNAMLPSYGLEPNSISYNTVMDAFVRAGDLKAAAGVLHDMCDHPTKEVGNNGGLLLLPNKRTYSIMMHALTGDGLIDDAFSLLETMNANPVSCLFVVSFSLWCCNKRGPITAFASLSVHPPYYHRRHNRQH